MFEVVTTILSPSATISDYSRQLQATLGSRQDLARQRNVQPGRLAAIRGKNADLI